MESFLSTSKKTLGNLLSYKTIRIVLGNQSCDLDSAVCALVQGLIEHLDLAKNHKEGVAVIPVLNIPENEFRIKTEVIFMLNYYGILFDHLTFRNQISFENVANSNLELEVILVDHHALANEDMLLLDYVVEVIDHRPQNALWLWPGKKVNIHMVGSCATLVAWNLLQKHKEILDIRLANFLRASILLDTCNFSEEAGRATTMDLNVIESLEEIGIVKSRDELYNEILSAKSDISGLTCNDLLIRDLKIVNGIPFVGFPLLVENYLQMEDAFSSLEGFAKSRKCTLTILIGLEHKDGHVRRDLAVFSLPGDQLQAKVIEALTSTAQPSLQLTLVTDIHLENYTLSHYKQENLKATRKYILPLVEKAIECANITSR